jgi:hypothetical protein
MTALPCLRSHQGPADALLVAADHRHPAPRRVAGQAWGRYTRARNRRTNHMGRGPNKTGIFVSFQAVSDLEGTFAVGVVNLS